MSIIQWSLPIPSSSIVLLLLTTKQQIWMFKNGLKIILIVENMFRNDASLRSSSKTCASICIFCRRLKTKLTSSNKKKKKSYPTTTAGGGTDQEEEETKGGQSRPGWNQTTSSASGVLSLNFTNGTCFVGCGDAEWEGTRWGTPRSADTAHCM